MGTSIAPYIISAVGSGISGQQKSNDDAKNRAAQIEQERQRLAEQQRQFNQNLQEQQRQYGGDYKQKSFDQNLSANTQYGDRAQSVNRELELLPMRDKASALMMQRMGAPAQQTMARSLAGGGTDALRGGGLPQMPYDLNAMKAQAEAYKPGDGGMSGDVQRQLLERYMNVPKAPEMDPMPAPSAASGPKESDQIAAIYQDMLSKGAPGPVIAQMKKALDAALLREGQGR